MTMLNGKVKRFCDRCGKPMEVGERVSIGMTFELSADTSRGYVEHVRSKGCGGKICRECAMEIADECKMQAPKEVRG